MHRASSKPFRCDVHHRVTERRCANAPFCPLTHDLFAPGIAARVSERRE